MKNTFLRVLVTGGAGFIGSHLVDSLVESGHQVAVVDNLSTGRFDQVNRNAHLFEMDLVEPALMQVLEEVQPQVVIHHAAQIDVRRSVANPVEDAHTNILGSLNLLEASVRYGAQKFIFASSGGTIYGEPRHLPCSERHPLKPLSPYGSAKAAIEIYLHYYTQVHGLDCFTLRYGNVYGPRQDPFGEAGVVSIFTQTLLDNRIPTIYGSGEQQRDFVYISDVIDANLACLNSKKPGAYNIGTGVGTSINRMFFLLRELTNSEVTPRYGPMRTGELDRIVLDSSRARHTIGWTPQVSLETGLAKTVEYFRGPRAAGPS